MEDHSKVSAELDLQASLKARETVLKDAAASYNGEVAVGQIPQGYNTNINIRLVRGRDLDMNPARLVCMPRGGGAGDPGGHIFPGDVLSEVLVAKFKEADKKMVDWLAQDEANAKLFLEQPVAALTKAGVELTREEQKALSRAHSETEKSRLVSPGVNVGKLSVTAYPDGRIGEIKSTLSVDPKGTGVSVKPDFPVKSSGSGDCGCGKGKR